MDMVIYYKYLSVLEPGAATLFDNLFIGRRSSQTRSGGAQILKDKKEKSKKDEPVVSARPPPWKRIGKAVLVALVINAIFLATIFIPVVGFVLVLMVGPYTGAFLGGRYLNRNKKGEWLGATLYIVVIWPTLLTVLVISVIQSLGLFALEIEPYGMAILSILYIVTLIFTLAGFYHGSEDMEEEVASQKKKKKKAPASIEPVPEKTAEPVIPKLEKEADIEKYPGEGGIDE
jgi:hypothetical protein